MCLLFNKELILQASTNVLLSTTVLRIIDEPDQEAFVAPLLQFRACHARLTDCIEWADLQKMQLAAVLNHRPF